MTAQKLQFEIKKLTGTNKDGKTYYRRTEVLRQLEEIQDIDFDKIKARIGVSDEKDFGSLKSETLVFLLRELFQKEGFEEIYETLSKRILRIIYHQKPENENRDDFAQRVQLEFLEKVLDFETNEGDYAQVSFGQFINGLALNEKSRHYTLNKRETVTDSIEADSENEENQTKFDFETRNLSPEDKTFINQALAKLPTKIRQAFVLHYYYNYKIKSIKKDEPTLTEYFGKSDKTIRNWLTEAEQILEDLRN